MGINIVLLAASLLSISVFCRSSVVDYWSEDYDEEKNCESEKEITSLRESGVDKKQCELRTDEDPIEAFRKCKENLASKLINFCKMTRIKQQGDLLYCRDRGRTTCCFANHACEATFTDITKDMTHHAVEYLKDKEKTLKEIQTSYGFHKCHPIEGYDATKCDEDCKNMKDTPLAKECAKRKGFLKCCIRRDKHMCHECRYCCSLPFCTYKNEMDEISQIGEMDISEEGGGTNNNTKPQDVKLSGLDYIYARNVLYKNLDFRCLKPDSNENPEEWEHYDPDDFANAVSQNELEKAKSAKFDKRFFNFEDPEVYQQMTGNDFLKNFKETYGYDFVGRFLDTPDESAMYPCSLECLKAERSSAAKKCRRKGGFFKCCVNTLGIEIFDETRKRLSEEKLISPYEPVCGADGKNCLFCTLTTFCSFKDRRTHLIHEEYTTKDFNPIGGIAVIQMRNFKRIPFKASYCIKQDFCQLKEEIYEPSEFLNAYTQEDMCNISGSVMDSNFLYEDEFHEKMEDCSKRKSNVRICPDNILEKIENKAERDLLMEVNEEFRKRRKAKKSGKKKKKSKKKSKGKKKKKKKGSKKRKEKKKHLKKEIKI